MDTTSRKRERRGTVLERRFQFNLRRLRERMGMTQAKFVDLLLAEGVVKSANYVSQLENGIRGASPELTERLATILQVDPAEFFLPSDEEEGAFPEGRPRLSTLPAAVVTRAKGAPGGEEPPPGRRSDLLEVPIVSGRIAAGSGLAGEDDVEDWAWIHRDQLRGRTSHRLQCIRVRGRSMESAIREQAVREGAIVCIDWDDLPGRGASSSPDAIYAVRIDRDQIVLKHVSVKDHVMVLVSTNPDIRSFPPIAVDLRIAPDPILGKVVWIWQAMA